MTAAIKRPRTGRRTKPGGAAAIEPAAARTNGRRAARTVASPELIARYPVGNLIATANAEEIQQLIARLLKLVGENPNREGLKKTPERVARSLGYLMRGYDQDPYEVLGDAVFTETYDEMVLVKDIDVLQPLRAPPAAVRRALPRRLHSAAEDCRSVQDRAAGRNVRPSPAGPGADDARDRPLHSGGPGSARASGW